MHVMPPTHALKANVCTAVAHPGSICDAPLGLRRNSQREGCAQRLLLPHGGPLTVPESSTPRSSGLGIPALSPPRLPPACPGLEELR